MQDPRSYILYNLRKTSAFCHSRISLPSFPRFFCHSRPPSVIPVKTGIQSGLDPQSEALRFRLRMTRGVSFPRFFCHSRPPFVIPAQAGIQSEWIPNPKQ